MALTDLIRKLDRTLCAPLVGYPSIQLTNSNVIDNLTNPTLQAVSLASLYKLVNFDILFPMMDLTAEAEALGAKVDWREREMPQVSGNTISSAKDAEAIVMPEIGKGNRLNVFIEVCRSLKQTFPERLVWAYATGPLSIASRLIGTDQMQLVMEQNPGLVHAVLTKCSELLTIYIKALLDTGVDGLMILEPALGGLSRTQANEFSTDYLFGLMDLINSRGKTSAFHCCGEVDGLIGSICATGTEVLSVGEVADLTALYPVLPNNVVLMGNLGTTDVFVNGTPTDVRHAALVLRDKMIGCERFIMSSGCNVPVDASIENLKALEYATVYDDAVAV